MRISDRIERLSPSLTLALIARTKELQAEGRPVISLGAGEPDFPTPANICAAGERAIREGHTRYTPVPGILPLRQAIAASYRERFGLGTDWRQTIVTTGAKQALIEALLALVNDGDEVLIPRPSWLSYPEMVKAAGGRPVFIPCREENEYRLEPDDLRRAAAGGARILIFNTISNPIGVVHSPEQIAALAEVAVELDLAVISDEIYERLIYPPARSTCFASAHPGAEERTIVVSGVSKTYAMTGWRIGWAAGPQNVISAMSKFQGQATSNTCSIAQHAALEAITGDQSEIDRYVGVFETRRDRIVELLRAIPEVTVPEPQGAFYAFPRVDAYYGRREDVHDSLSLAAALLEESNLVVVPGKPFGGDAHVRVSYACSMEQIEEGVGRLSRFLQSL